MTLRRSIKDGSFLWLGLVLMIALIIAFLLPVAPEDFWWYMRVGQETVTNGAIPVMDTLTYSIAGQAIYYHSWGASVLFYLLYKLNGLNLIVLLRGLLVLITYGMLWFTSRELRGGRIGSSLVLLIGILASSNNWSVRPQLFGYPLFALSLWILYRWQKGDKKLAWWLPVIALVWGNLHASFVMLFLLMLAAIVFGEGDRRLLLIVFGAALVAICVNPRGLQTWQYVWQLLTSPSNMQFSREWGPPINTGWQMNLFFGWLLLFPVLAIFSPRKLSKLEWTWFAGFGFMALWGLRYGVWFILVLTVLTVQLLGDWEERWLPENGKKLFALDLALPLLLIAATSAFLPALRSLWWPDSPGETSNTPVQAANWLREHPEIDGPLVSEMGFASYLEFVLPERPVWIDSRVFPFPTNMWEDYKNFSLGYWNWEQSLNDTKANIVMASQETQPKLILALSNSTDWCKVYSDEVAEVYTRGGCAR